MATPARDDTASYLLPQSLLPRALAYLIDTAVVAVTMAALVTFGVIPGGELETLDASSLRELMQSNTGLELWAIMFAYYIILEGSWGRTIGKRLLGISVARAKDGSPCGWTGSVVRNLLRPIDLFFAGLPGAVVVLFSPTRQRLGDMLAGTLVVREVRVPGMMLGVVPGLLRRCPQCGRLAPASGPCPGCAAPAPAPARAPQMAQVLQPLAGMMAVGEAAAAFRVAANGTLAAEAAFGAASAAESARLTTAAAAGAAAEGAGANTEPAAEAPEVAPVKPASLAVGAEEDDADDVGAQAAGAGEGGSEAFVHTADAPELSDDYVAAWRGLMTAVETLRERRADLNAALAQARVTLDQVGASDAMLRELLEETGPYLDADDDEAVLAAFMARAALDGEATKASS